MVDSERKRRRNWQTDKTRQAGWQVDRDTDRLTRQWHRQTEQQTDIHLYASTSKHHTHTHCFKAKELIPKHTKSWNKLRAHRNFCRWGSTPSHRVGCIHWAARGAKSWQSAVAWWCWWTPGFLGRWELQTQQETDWCKYINTTYTYDKLFVILSLFSCKITVALKKTAKNLHNVLSCPIKRCSFLTFCIPIFLCECRQSKLFRFYSSALTCWLPGYGEDEKMVQEDPRLTDPSRWRRLTFAPVISSGQFHPPPTTPSSNYQPALPQIYFTVGCTIARPSSSSFRVPVESTLFDHNFFFFFFFGGSSFG